MSEVVLVTGGFGYVGGRVAQRLASEDAWLPRLATRRPAPVHPAWLARGEAVSMPAGRPQEWSAALHGVAAIVHLAGSNEVDAGSDPLGALEATAAETERLVSAAGAAGVPRLLYMSTAHVYGSALVGTVTEDTLPRPLHPYAITHRCAEDFVLAAAARKDIDAIVVRLSNGIGSPAHPDVNRWTLIGNDLCRQVVQTGRIALRTSGCQWRDFVTLDDVAEAVVLLLRSRRDEIHDRVVNLGGELPLRILDVAERIAARARAVLGITAPIERPAGLPAAAQPIDYRIDRLRALGYRPRKDLDSELDRTLQLCATAFGNR